MSLLAVVAIVLYRNFRKPAAGTDSTSGPTTEVSYLFPAGEGTPTSISIKAKSGESLELARNSENAWVLRPPIEAGAASQVSTMRVLEKIAKIDPDLVGNREPEYILTINSAAVRNELSKSVLLLQQKADITFRIRPEVRY
jgi:hypothetical protein